MYIAVMYIEALPSVVRSAAARLGVHGGKVHSNMTEEEARAAGKPPVNRAVIFQGTRKVTVDNIGYPKMQDPLGNPMNNGGMYIDII